MSADDVFLRSASVAPAEEIRLTSFGWEAGPADWSPDGRRLVFCSWEKGGPAGISYPWIVTIDPQSGKPLRTERLALPPPLKTADEAVWSPDGADLAIEENTGQTARATLDRQSGWHQGAKARRLPEHHIRRSRLDARRQDDPLWRPRGKPHADLRHSTFRRQPGKAHRRFGKRPPPLGVSERPVGSLHPNLAIKRALATKARSGHESKITQSLPSCGTAKLYRQSPYELD